MKCKAIAIIVACAALPAYAGTPDNPGQKGQIVNHDKEYWQNETGDKNGWGQTVSRVATEEGNNRETSLGAFLDFMAGGPNPFNDQGSGNN